MMRPASSCERQGSAVWVRDAPDAPLEQQAPTPLTQGDQGAVWCTGSRKHLYAVTVTVACMLGWIVQVNVYVPAVGNLMDFESPGEKLTPLAVANSIGAPDAAVNLPDVPVTMMWVPPELAGSLKVTDPPALMVALLPVKLNAPMVIVAPPLPVVGDAAVVEVGAGGTGVSVGVAATLLSPQAASVNAKSSIRTSPSLRM